MNRCLFISMHQFGQRTGGSIASGNFLKIALGVFDGRVRVVAAKESKPYLEALKVEQTVLVSSRNYWSKLWGLLSGTCADRFSPYCDGNLDALLDGINHVILDGSMIGRFAKSIKRRYPDVHVTQLHHNYEKAFYRDHAQRWFVRPFHSRVIDYNQGGGWHASDLNLVFTERDLNDLKGAYGEAESGVSKVFGYFEEVLPLENRESSSNDQLIHLVITGNMSVRKGYAGAIWFVREIMPKLDGVRLTIAGRAPVDELRDLCQELDNVQLVANPEDMSVVLNAGDVFVNPSSEGSGIKVRNFDGLRRGIPVLCHEGNRHGFEALPSDVFGTFNDLEGFADGLNRLCEASIESRSVRERVYESYCKHFSLSAGEKKLKQIMI